MSSPATSEQHGWSLPAAGERVPTLIDGGLMEATLVPDGDGWTAADPQPLSALPPAGTPIACPRPLDLHIHGGGGAAVPPHGDAAIVSAAAAPADWIATMPLPGTPLADLPAAVAACSAAASTEPRCAGIRIEGLFINPAQRGVWPEHGLAPCDRALLDDLHAAANGQLRIIDVAPELPGAMELIARARELELVVALAHSTADAAVACAAVDAGATLATHTFNAMPPMHHREPGLAGWVLADDRVTIELIADGHHVHPAMLQVAARAAGPGRVAVVSDASPLAGTGGPESMDWAGGTIQRVGDRCQTGSGDLAGAAMMLWDVLAATPLATDPVDWLIAGTAAPRRVLEPLRPLGVAPGDDVLLLPLPRRGGS